jgi:hypothetical protein
MDRLPIESSNIKAIGYDPQNRIMEVEFGKDVEAGYWHNRLYHYFEVPPEMHQALLDAPSKGEFLYANIAFEFTYKYLGTLDELEY